MFSPWFLMKEALTYHQKVKSLCDLKHLRLFSFHFIFFSPLTRVENLLSWTWVLILPLFLSCTVSVMSVFCLDSHVHWGFLQNVCTSLILLKAGILLLILHVLAPNLNSMEHHLFLSSQQEVFVLSLVEFHFWMFMLTLTNCVCVGVSIIVCLEDVPRITCCLHHLTRLKPCFFVFSLFPLTPVFSSRHQLKHMLNLLSLI